MRSKSLFFLTLLFAASLLLFKLGSVPLFEPDEGRYANISQTMLSNGDWITPRKNGFAHFHKPPLPYWSMALSQKLLGSDEFGVRFPGVLFALGILVLTFGIARLLKGGVDAFFSILILLAIPLFLFMSRLATTDIGMVFWVELAVYCFLLARISGNGAAILGAYVALGLAMMTKGPVTLILYFLAVIPFLVTWKDKKEKPSILYHVLGLGLFLAVALPWYLWVIHANPGLLKHFLVYQTTERIASKAHHPNTLFYFLPLFIATFFPWSFFFPALVRENLSLPKGSTERKAGFWLILWSAGIFLFFSLVPSKLASYILPLSVPYSLALSGYFSRKIDGTQPDRWLQVSAVAAGFILWAGGIGLGIYTKFFLHDRIEGFGSAFLVLACLLPLFGLGILYFAGTRRAKSLFFTLLLAVYTAAFVIWGGMTHIGTYKTIRPFAWKILELRKGGEPVLVYRKMFPGLPFYLKERVIEVDTKTPAPFDEPEAKRPYLLEDPAMIGQFIEGSKRCFIVTKVSDASDLEVRYPGKLEKLLEGNKIALYSNR